MEERMGHRPALEVKDCPECEHETLQKRYYREVSGTTSFFITLGSVKKKYQCLGCGNVFVYECKETARKLDSPQ